MVKERPAIPPGKKKPIATRSGDGRLPQLRRTFPESALAKKLKLEYETHEKIKKQGAELLDNCNRLIGDTTKAIEMMFKRHWSPVVGKHNTNPVKHEIEQGIYSMCQRETEVKQYLEWKQKTIKETIANLRAQKNFLLKKEKQIQEIFGKIESGNRPRIPNPFPKVISDLKHEYKDVFHINLLLSPEDLKADFKRPIKADNVMEFGSERILYGALGQVRLMSPLPENSIYIRKSPTSLMINPSESETFLGRDSKCFELCPGTELNMKEADHVTNSISCQEVNDDTKMNKEDASMSTFKKKTVKSLNIDSNNIRRQKSRSSTPLPAVQRYKPIPALKNSTHASSKEDKTAIKMLKPTVSTLLPVIHQGNHLIQTKKISSAQNVDEYDKRQKSTAPLPAIQQSTRLPTTKKVSKSPREGETDNRRQKSTAPLPAIQQSTRLATTKKAINSQREDKTGTRTQKSTAPLPAIQQSIRLATTEKASNSPREDRTGTRSQKSTALLPAIEQSTCLSATKKASESQREDKNGIRRQKLTAPLPVIRQSTCLPTAKKVRKFPKEDETGIRRQTSTTLTVLPPIHQSKRLSRSSKEKTTSSTINHKDNKEENSTSPSHLPGIHPKKAINRTHQRKAIAIKIKSSSMTSRSSSMLEEGTQKVEAYLEAAKLMINCSNKPKRKHRFSEMHQRSSDVPDVMDYSSD